MSKKIDPYPSITHHPSPIRQYKLALAPGTPEGVTGLSTDGFHFLFFFFSLFVFLFLFVFLILFLFLFLTLSLSLSFFSLFFFFSFSRLKSNYFKKRWFRMWPAPPQKLYFMGDFYCKNLRRTPTPNLEKSKFVGRNMNSS